MISNLEEMPQALNYLISKLNTIVYQCVTTAR